jgi:3',5'-cyclic AMP phosphodiesterase CpdA
MIYDIDGNVISSGESSEGNLYEIASASRVNTFVSGYASNPVSKKNNLTFAVITDIHGDSDRLNSFIEYANQYKELIDFAIILGDNVSNLGTESTTFYDTALSKAELPVFATLGNHDVRNLVLSSAISKVFGTIKSKGWLTSSDFGSSSDCYWFKDFADYKIRVIGLNDFDNADSLWSNNGGSNESRAEYKWYDTAQLQWFADTLYTTPLDYAVLIFSHMPYVQGEPTVAHSFTKAYSATLESPTAIDGEPIGDILNAYKTGTSINNTYSPTSAMSSYFSKTATVSKDFSGRGTGIYVGHICGHDHASVIATHPTYTTLNDIVCPSGSNNVYQRQWDDIPPYGNDNFNVIAVDPSMRTINLVKVGTRLTADIRHRTVDKVTF